MSATEPPLLPFILPEPREGARPDLLVIAGEHSGDQQAALAVGELLQRLPEMRIAAVGGPELQRAGAQLLHDLTDSSVVGVVEVLKHYRFFKSVFDATVSWIRRHRPRAVCLVDYPGFNLRLAERLRQEGLSRPGGGEVQVLYYISPQIWAWKARRRFAMARSLDAIAVIFPFEPECYADTELPVSFVGHPFVLPQYRPPLRFDAKGPVLLLPGSRRAAVSRIFPALLDGFAHYGRTHASERAVVLYPGSEIQALLEQELAARPELAPKVTLTGFGSGEIAARAVLTSSGTMSLHCALAAIPGAIAYRANPITYLLGRWLVRVPHLGIHNLLLGELMYPEYIQGASTPANLARELEASSDPQRLEAIRRQAERLKAILQARSEESAGAWLERRLEADGGHSARVRP